MLASFYAWIKPFFHGFILKKLMKRGGVWMVLLAVGFGSYRVNTQSTATIRSMGVRIEQELTKRLGAEKDLEVAKVRLTEATTQTVLKITIERKEAVITGEKMARVQAEERAHLAETRQERTAAAAERWEKRAVRAESEIQARDKLSELAYRTAQGYYQQNFKQPLATPPTTPAR